MSLRADTTRVLQEYDPTSPDQVGLRTQFLDHVVRYEDALSRTCRPAHITASALVLDRRQLRVLLTLHPKVGRWLQLGGHCEPVDQTLAGAALREATEESGVPGLQVVGGPLRLDRHAVRCGQDGSTSDHLDVQFVALAPVGAQASRSAESLDLRWFGVDELPDGADESVRALVRAGVAACG